MAYTESGELPVGQGYWLGSYSFELHVDQVHEPGEEDVVSVYAVCRGPDGSRETQTVDFPAGAEVESWSVEANETEASVYAQIGGGVNAAVGTASTPLSNGMYSCDIAPRIALAKSGDTIYLTKYENKIYYGGYGGRIAVLQYDPPSPYGWYWTASYSENFGYLGFEGTADIGANIPESESNPRGKSIESVIEPGEHLIGRFAIDLKDADGGPGGGWDEPGSVEPDPEDPQEPEPTHTLTLTAIAALSGRHNDPLNDTSYSYLPADNTAIKPYGCGGDGGHGGGGGGGASTMVVRKIVTDKASHVEVVAHTKRHGYGSGGGKGGKGGDGCILIFW